MKKAIKIISFLLVGVMVLGTFSSCIGELKQTKLSAPIVVAYEDTLSWNKIEGAVSYDIYIDGKFYTSTTNERYLLALKAGEYDIKIVAKGDGKGTVDSEFSNEVRIVKNDSTSIVMHTYLDAMSWNYEGILDESVEFIELHQVKDPTWWRAMERTFSEHRDNDGGYSAEFWGKLLRGGVMGYKYTGDEEAYAQMEQTVRNVIDIQKNEPDGRLSGFDVDYEFTGWDLRSRSYNLLGMEYFYEICKDEALKKEILDSLCAQLDYIMKYVGEGKINILETSPDWGGCTSANMLEGVVRLYELSGKEEYKDYAKYIIETGGSTMLSSEGKNIIEDAISGTPMYKWGCRKFYEISNFMCGVLRYYIATGDEYAKRISVGFYNAVDASEITATGGVATDVEEAENSRVEQANPDNTGRMQETCAVVSWMRFCADFYSVTGDAGIIDNLEKAYYNFMIGAVDWELHNDWPLFSYSPLATTARQDVYSGTAFLADGTVQSCCVISGVSGLPVIIDTSLTKMADGFSVNLYIPGQVKTNTNSGTTVIFDCDTTYPVDGHIGYTLTLARPESFSIRFRIPAWCKNAEILVNGEQVGVENENGYCTINREWKSSDTVELVFDMKTTIEYGSEECSNPNGKYNALISRGPLVFARDSRIEGHGIFTPLNFAVNEDGTVDSELGSVNFDSQCALSVKLTNGNYATLVDYGSAGKTMNDDSIMCLWIPTVDYWSIDITKDVMVYGGYDKAPSEITSEGHVVVNPLYVGVSSSEMLNLLSWKLEKDGDYYRIKFNRTGGYLTVRDDTRVISISEKIDERQLFELRQCGMNKYKLVLVSDGRVLSRFAEDNVMYLTADISHPNQYWIIEEIK